MTPAPAEEPRRPSPRAPGRMRRAASAAAAALGLALVFTGAAAVGVALHLDTPAARRVARDATNRLLGSLFYGRIVADEIDRLGLNGVRIRSAVAIDPRGNKVIRASGIAARADVLAIVRGALLGTGALRVEVPSIRVEQIEVLVQDNGAGGVTLGDTFAPLPPSRPPSSAPEAPPREVVVALSRIEIGRGWVHGQLAPPRALDADINRLVGSVHVGPDGVAVDVDQTGLVDRAFLPARTAGTANYHLRAGEKVRMWSSFAGRLADVEITARAVLDEDHLEAHASVPRATPEQLRSLLPDHPLTEPVAARVAVNGHLPQLDVAASFSADPAGPAGGSVALAGRLDVTGPVRLDADVQARDVDLRLFGVRFSSDTTGGEPGAAPARTGAAPARTGTAPARTGTAPARTGTAPARTGAAPARTGAAPARTGTAPARTGTAPARTGAAPARTGAAPARTGAAPARTGAAATTAAPETGRAPEEASTSITAEGRVRAELGDELRLAVEARTEPTELLGERVPAADVHLVLDRGELHVRTHLHEPGAPIDAAVSLLPGGQGIRFAATADIPAIAAAPRLAGPVDGAGRVRVEGSLRDGALDAQVEGAFARLRVGPDVALASARFAGRVTGPLDALAVSGSLSGQEALAGGRTFDEVTAQISGPLAAPKLRATVTDGDDALDASARLSSATLALRDIELQLKRDGAVVAGRIAAIDPSAGGLAVEGLELASPELGSLKGRLAVRGDDVTGRLQGDDIDVGRLARMLGIPLRVRGRADVDVALDHDRKTGRSGHVRLDLTGGEVAFLSGVSARLTATFERDQLKADGLVRIDAAAPQPSGGRAANGAASGAASGALPRCAGTLASVRVSGAEGTLKGPLLRAETWAGLVGQAEVAADDWDLGCLARLMPIAHVVSEVRGRLTTRFRVSRAPGEAFPSLHDVLVRTQGLALAGPHRLGAERPAWDSRFIDAQLKGSLDGTTGRAEAALTLYDGGLLADASGSIDLDLAALAGPPAGRWPSLLRSPIAAQVSFPRRAVDELTTLPSFVRDALPPLAGELRIDAYAGGTLARPSLTARTLWWGLTYAPPGATGATELLFPTDLDAWLTYDSEKATLDAHVTRGPDEIATARAEVIAPLDRLLAEPSPRALRGAPPPPAWTGRFRATLRDVPLGEIPLLGDSGIGGRVSGEIEVRDLNVAPALTAHLTLPGVTIGSDLAFERGVLSVRIDPKRGTDRGELRVTELALEGPRGGKLRANAYASVRFRHGFLPIPDGERTDLALSAERFRLAALQPLVGGLLSKIDGTLDGDLRVELGGASGDEGGSVRAQLEVRDGVVHIPELGQELRDVAARVTADGGVVRIEGLRAAGTTGLAQGWALLRLNGLALRDGAGALTIADDQALPLTLEGVPLGTASGMLSFIAEKKPGELALYATVPRLRLTLPATSSRDVQPLGDNPDISVSHPLGPEKQKRAADALRYAMTFDVRDAAVSGAGLRLWLRSDEDAPPRVEIGEDVRVSGGIVIARGALEIYGKAFEIEGGRVRLREEEASNPHLNATAHWDAPDGTRIHVAFNGNLRPITERSLRFTSSPPSSQQDILARLLLGADFSEGAQAAGAETPAGVAVGRVAASVGSELATAQFNALLSGIAPLRGLSTRFGTTADGTLRTSLVYRLNDDLTAQATFQEGSVQGTTSESGPTPGGTASERGTRTEITIDWRFDEHWTLRGTVGVDERQTTSGVLDLLWHYRY
ncbi:translocation/assembly module TamB domain-containing protein [Sorangium sp. So ce341]|uniref:translocation/assembly module TamB domain-containing protein n=1 Tax=Sorangium sp. So ce341 TaxID=3133302 RepID=UPI003F638A14